MPDGPESQLLRVVSTNIDLDTDAAYLKFSGDGVVAKTVPYSDRIFVDLDENDAAVGVELVLLSSISINAEVFCRRFKLSSSVAEEIWRVHMNAGLGHKNPEVASEFRALGRVLDGLEPLDSRVRLRVLRRAFDRLDDSAT